jgi:hypothetical protein
MLSVHAAGSANHRQDLVALSASGRSIPHQYYDVSDPDALWCRIASDGRVRSGFLVRVQRSRAVPGTRLLRVERFGRSLHQPILPEIGSILRGLIQHVGRVLRLNVELFDEDQAGRAATLAALMGAGMRPTPSRSYRETLRLRLGAGPADVFGTLSSSTRRNVRTAERSGLVVAAIDRVEYVPRLRAMYVETFRRTGAEPPPLDFDAMMSSSIDDARARVFGVFAADRIEPEGLAAFAWVRSHGDYASYDVAASTRLPELGRTPVGYPLLWRTVEWAMSSGHRWFDLGGVLPESAPSSHPLAGISAFKRGFSEDRVVVGDELMLEPSTMLRGVGALSQHLAAIVRRTK